MVVNLKNDAMKTRHWQKLMDLTSVAFDTTLKTLTLSNIFSMELHKVILNSNYFYILHFCIKVLLYMLAFCA